jgi:hypothetical protein
MTASEPTADQARQTTHAVPIRKQTAKPSHAHDAVQPSRGWLCLVAQSSCLEKFGKARGPRSATGGWTTSFAGWQSGTENQAQENRAQSVSVNRMLLDRDMPVQEGSTYAMTQGRKLPGSRVGDEGPD